MEVLDREGPVVNEIRKLESRLWRLARKDGLKTIMLTSAVQGEGKSTTAALLASAIALHRARRVLAVDLDFRWPNLHSHFGVEPSTRFTEYLLGQGELAPAVVGTEISNLSLVAGAPEGGEDPDYLLNSPRLADAIDTFRE
jgi:Mrp family chromosome partitioning ATPase